MSTIIQSLRCHRDELKIELGNYNNKSTLYALTETWLTDNDVLENDYDLENYQSLTEAKHPMPGTWRCCIVCQKVGNYKVFEF